MLIRRPIAAGIFVLACMPGPTPSVAHAQRDKTSHRAWWTDEDVQHTLALTADQVKRLSLIFQRDLAQRRAVHDSIELLDAELNRVIGEQDEPAAIAVLGRLEVLRRAQNTRRALMLVDMYRTLTPVQRRELAALTRSASSR